MNFIQKEGPGKIINLDNVSSIGVKYKKGTKIIFNFSHSITIDNGMMVADYEYWRVDDGEEDSIIKEIIERLGDDAIISTDDRHYIVNAKNVANILFDENNRRVIFNLNFSKEIKVHGGYRLSSDFTYWDYDSQDEFENAVDAIKTKINTKVA